MATIIEEIQKKEKELEELKAIRTLIKDTVYEFYRTISRTLETGDKDSNYDKYLPKAQEGFGKRIFYPLRAPWRSPIITRFTSSIVKDAMEEVTGNPETSVDSLDIETIKEVSSIIKYHLDEWLERYWFS